MNFPVGSEAILPVICSLAANMWWLRLVGSGSSVMGRSGDSTLSGCTSDKVNALFVVLNLVDRWFLRVWSK